MKIKDMFINCYFKLEKEAYWKPMSEQERVLACKFLISDTEFNAFLNEYMDSLNVQCKKTGQSIKKILISTTWTEKCGTAKIIVTTVEGTETISPDFHISFGDFDTPAEIVKNGHDLRDQLLLKAMIMNKKVEALKFLTLLGLIITLVAIAFLNEDKISTVIRCSLIFIIWGSFMTSNLFQKICEKIIYPEYVETNLQDINIKK